MGLASLGLEIGISCDFLYSVLLLNAILGSYCLGLALYPGRRYDPGYGFAAADANAPLPGYEQSLKVRKTPSWPRSWANSSLF